MSWLIVLLCIAAYLFIGGFLSGLVLDTWIDEPTDYVIVVGGWPLILFVFIIMGITYGPMKLGQFIKGRKK